MQVWKLVRRAWKGDPPTFSWNCGDRPRNDDSLRFDSCVSNKAKLLAYFDSHVIGCDSSTSRLLCQYHNQQDYFRNSVIVIDSL